MPDLGWWPVRRAVVRGRSMEPALRDGDIVLAIRWVVPRPGWLVLVTWESRPGQLSVKRAVRPVGDLWWVVGDNPELSSDSRKLGPAQVIAVVPGRVRKAR